MTGKERIFAPVNNLNENNMKRLFLSFVCLCFFVLTYYVEKAKPVFIDKSLFRTIIPLVRYTMADHVNNWLSWLNLDPKWLPKLTESLKNIEIDAHLQKMTWDEQIEYLVPSWNEKGTKFDKKGTKSEKSYNPDNQKHEINDRPSPNEKGTDRKSVV